VTPLIERAVVADFGRLAHHHAHAVVDEHAPADVRAGWISMPVNQRARVLDSRASHLNPTFHSQCDMRCQRIACRPG